MLLDVRPSDQSLEIEIDLQTVNWFDLMRVLQSNFLKIDDTLIQAALRNIDTSGLKTNRQQKAYKNLVLNGGRGIYDLHSMNIQDRYDIAVKYAIDAKFKNICVYSVFQQMEKWERLFKDQNLSVYNLDVKRNGQSELSEQNPNGNVIISTMLNNTVMRPIDGLNFDFVIYDVPLEGAVLSFPSLNSLFPNLILMPVNFDFNGTFKLKNFVSDFAWTKEQHENISKLWSPPLFDKINTIDHVKLFKKIRLTI